MGCDNGARWLLTAGTAVHIDVAGPAQEESSRMDLNDIAVVILTKNERDNIERTLSHLTWASEVVVVDSISDDGTVELAQAFDNVRVEQRPFDQHARQWNFAVHGTGIERPWILALDADFIVGSDVVSELRDLQPPDAIAGYNASFIYSQNGQPLRGTLFPARPVLFRRARGRYYQHGHSQREAIDGPLGELKAKIIHDDRKPLGRWLESQGRYSKLESRDLMKTPWSQMRWQTKLRTVPGIAPALSFFAAYVLKRGILDGKAGLDYALQRAVAEGILSIQLIRSRTLGEPEVAAASLDAIDDPELRHQQAIDLIRAGNTV